ncbi:MAG: hypothetical protein ABI379_10110 [Rhodanobacter sp.]
MYKSYAVVLAVLASCGLAQSASAGPGPDPALAQLHFRFLGPNGNRDIAVVGVPGDPNVAYFAAASGGIWKTTDGGAHFKSIFDSTDVSSVGALALAPSNPDVVWAGTGEPYIIREATSVGDGVYKSTDAGHTWEHAGLELTGHISNIKIDPKNPQIVYVCAIGQAYKPNAERGVFRTEDGGKSWKLVLKVNDTTGCSGLDMDPKDPNTLFAGMWQVQIRPWNLDSGGSDGGVFVTHDAGNTWSRLTGHGLPAKGALLGKIAVRVAPSDSKVVYALMQAKTGLLYRSSDSGENWDLVHQGDDVNLRAPYYTNFTVAPNNENLLFIPSTAFMVSFDGGHSIVELSRSPPAGRKIVAAGGDSHDVWIDPKDPNRILTADDTGGAISHNGGESWLEVSLPIAQIYHVYTDNSIPYNVIGNRQDNDGEEAPSRLLTPGDGGKPGPIPASAWHAYGGCDNESGFGVPDPTDPNIIWSGCYNGDLTRIDLRTGQSRNVAVWPVATYGAAPSSARDRWNWTFPIAISPSDHNRVYVGSDYVYETNDAGQTWKRISPDLTTGKHSGDSGGLTTDNLGTFESASLSMIDESPVKPGVIWAGSYDGQVSVTRDEGAHWANVTANITGMPPWGTINLEASRFDAGSAIITSNIKMMGDYKPYIFKTTDYGKTWKNISGDLPHSEFSFVHIVREDPVRKGMLYAGTENDLYVSWDDGAHWTQLRNNFPPAPVYWLQIQPQFNDLAIATYGRGIWILDDVTALRSWDSVAQAGKAHLFDPRPAYRFRTVVTEHQDNPNGATVGENIPYGADLNYYLPDAAPVTLTIADSSGKTVRVLHEQGTRGLNRVFWDLRLDPLHTATLLTNPPGKPWVNTPPHGRALSVWGEPSPAVGPLVVPGAFQVSLSVGDTPMGTAPLQVLADPHTLGTTAEMQAQEQLLLGMEGQIDQVVDLINRFEDTRKQIETLTGSLGADAGAAHVRSAAKTLENQAVAVESRLFDIHNAGSSEDSFQESPQLYEKLGSLYNNLNNVGADEGPTAAETEVSAELRQVLASIQQAAGTFGQTDVARFNALAHANGVSAQITPH